MLTTKFSIHETLQHITGDIINEFLVNNDIRKIIFEGSPTTFAPVDDGPPTFYKSLDEYVEESEKWINSMFEEAGWKILGHILSANAEDPAFDTSLEYNFTAATAYGKIGDGEGFKDPVGRYKSHLRKVVGTLGWEIINWLGISGKTTTGVSVAAPVLPGVGTKDNIRNTTRAQKAAGKWKTGKSKMHTLSIKEIKEGLLDGNVKMIGNIIDDDIKIIGWQSKDGRRKLI